jgi:hypothetical protein
VVYYLTKNIFLIKDYIRKAQQIREIPEIALKVKLNLWSVKQDQILLVNTAKVNEKPIAVQLVVISNDPFIGSFTCCNDKQVTNSYEYEFILEIISSKSLCYGSVFYISFGF